ncbi:HET-domain-containing protein [Hypoxylon argillaceum]|nr:HET-domain-containing protein [Hypoxylon argillaceum]
MSLDSLPIATKLDLCQQCQFLFSTRGFEQLLSVQSFRHSQLCIFVDRPYCRFCCYLWNDDLLGASSQVYKIRCLRDLLSSARAIASSRESEELRRCWVVISRPVMDQYIMGFSGSVFCMEPNTVGQGQTIKKAVDRFFVSVETEEGKMKWQGFSPLRLIAPKSSSLAKYTNYRHVSWNGLTSQWVADIKAILQLCLTSHPQCQQSRSRVLPTRLLQIRKNNGEANFQVQLITTTAGHTGEYAALSYCWGGPQPLQLTKSTIQDFLQQPIERGALPLGLSDAVEVAYSLELEYLWVDALCIIQDDQDDKKREINRMGDIYQNSFFTIAAATSSSVHDSFLRTRSVLNTKYRTCDVPFTLDSEDCRGSGDLGSITVVPVHAHRSDSFPLNKRGWAFQEALLPLRLLVFGDLEPFVRCRTRNVIHKAPTCIDYAMSALRPRRIIDRLANSQAHERGLFTDTKANSLDFLWREIVQQYTLRELSIPEDRPFAISGVIDFLAETFNDECHFGVRKSCAVICLLWKTESLEWRGILPDVPTWSWMSLTTPVDLETVVYFDKSEALVEWDADTSHTRLLVTCCVLEADNVYGPVSDFGSDVHQPGFETVEECAFLVLSRTTNGRYMAIIVIDEEEGVYRRCGLAELNLLGSWRTQPKRQIVLV